MIGVLGKDAELQGYTGPGTTWANKMNFSMNHAPGAGLISGPVDLQSNTLPLCSDFPLFFRNILFRNRKGLHFV